MDKINKNKKILLIGTVVASTLLPIPFVISCASNQTHSGTEGVKPPTNGTDKPSVNYDEVIYTTSDGFYFDDKGLIVGYDGTSNIIDLRKVLVDRNNSNIRVTPTEIASKVFWRKKIQKAYIPTSIVKIGDYAFAKTGIGEVVFEDINNSQLKTIGTWAFENHVLNNISIPKNVEWIGPSAFYTKKETTKFKTINFNGNEKLTEISEFTFYGNLFKEIVIPKNVKAIRRGASVVYVGTDDFSIIVRKYRDFEYDSSSTSVNSFYGYRRIFFDTYTNPNQKTNIFETTDGLIYSKSGEILLVRNKNAWDNLVISERLIDKDTHEGVAPTRIGNDVFKFSWRIKSLEIPKTIKSIGDYAFSYTTNLKEFKINLKDNETSDLESIGRSAFHTNLIETLDLSKTKIREIKDYSFYVNPLKMIKLPNHVVNIGKDAFFAGFKGDFITIEGQRIETDYSNVVVEVYLAKEMFATISEADFSDHIFGPYKNFAAMYFIKYK